MQITTRGGHLRLDDTVGTSIVPIARLSIITRLFIHMCTCIDDIDVDRRNYESSQSSGLHYACLSLRKFSLRKFVQHTSKIKRIAAARSSAKRYGTLRHDAKSFPPCEKQKCPWNHFISAK